MDYKKELEKLSTEELKDIVVIGENLHIPNSKASVAKRILDYRIANESIKAVQSNLAGMINIGKTYDSYIKSAGASLSAISSISNSLASIPTLYKDLLTLPSTSAINSLMLTLKDVQKTAGTAAWQEIANSAINSPILESVKSIGNINLNFSNPVPNSVPIQQEIVSNIESALDEKTDTIYNFAAYKWLFTTETLLRKIIEEKVIKPSTEILSSKIPQAMLNSWNEKKHEEEANIHSGNTNYSLIEYSDFTDLKSIFQKKSTRRLLAKYINEDNLATITSKLFELEPIRLKIAHSRALTVDEFDTIRVYAKKISRLLESLNSPSE